MSIATSNKNGGTEINTSIIWLDSLHGEYPRDL